MAPSVSGGQRSILPLVLAVALVVGSSQLRAAETQIAEATSAVDLLRWQGIAEITGRGQITPEHFRLVASVRWAADAAREASKYRIRVDLPDGLGAVTYPLAGGESPGPSSRTLSVWVPAAAVRDRRASAVKVEVRLIDAATGQQVSRDALTATAVQFPRDGSHEEAPPDRFGWGVPLQVKDGGAQAVSRTAPDPTFGGDLNEGPQGHQFVRVFRAGDQPGFFVGVAESRIDQVKAFVKGYDPNLRAGEFVFFPDSPAFGVSPAHAESYLTALGRAEGWGLEYRLPARGEWLRMAKAGRSTRFWWGDNPDDKAARQGANFKGAEKPVTGSGREDELDIIRPTASGGMSQAGFKPNPWGLWHTFGNVSEWATDGSGGYLMMGGNFRTERDAANFRAEDLEVAAKKGEPPPQPFVGVRVVADITPESGKAAIESVLRGKSAHEGPFSGVTATYDPETATGTITGPVLDLAARVRADELLRPLWFLASLTNQLTLRDGVAAGDQVASLGGALVEKGVRTVVVPSGAVYLVPVAVHWGYRMPVEGSDYWINVYRLDTGARISGTQLSARKVGHASRIEVPIEAARMAASGLAITAPVTIAISLGKEPAQATNDPKIVSNLAELRWTIETKHAGSATSGSGRAGVGAGRR